MVSSVYNAFVDNLICEQQIEAFSQWVITDKTDTVFNYPCKMAKTVYAGRNYTAWFTLEIPVSDGPWSFVKREKKRNMVNFYSGGQLYMTYRNSPITYIDMEIKE